MPPASKKNIIVVIGTRPEAIKMAPVFLAAKAHANVNATLLASGQHRELVQSALQPFGLKPDIDLDVMSPGQTPNDVLARVLARLGPVLQERKPDALLVQGDTTTTLAAALCAYHLRVPVGHVEAGLRTYDHENPFPEEANRQMVARIATWSFPPTEAARDNLLQEHISRERIHVTGNTAVDALLHILGKEAPAPLKGRYVLMTLHRRESFGEPLKEILLGIRDFLETVTDAQLVWPVHPNPAVVKTAEEVMGGLPRMHRMEPIPYDRFAAFLRHCAFVITDSGGIQEEGPSLGKTVLIARETTERPEAVTSGQNRLMGRQRKDITAAMHRAWGEPAYAGPLPAPSPYGDGKSAQRIVQLVVDALHGHR